MATARDLIVDALIEVGTYSVGDSLSAADAALGLTRLQGLIDGWRAEQLAMSVQYRATYTVPSGISTFTIGPTGDVVLERPTYIESMNYINPGSSPANEVAMGPMDRDAYAAQSQKTLVSGLPQQYFFQPTLPDASMFIWPTPNQDVTVAIYILQGLSDPVTLNSEVNGPAGYREALLYALALRLCAPFGFPVTPELRTMALASWRRMTSPNVQPGIMGVDAALTPHMGSAFNVLTGNYTGSSNQ